jgi:hypothetical protein
MRRTVGKLLTKSEEMRPEDKQEFVREVIQATAEVEFWCLR